MLQEHNMLCKFINIYRMYLYSEFFSEDLSTPINRKFIKKSSHSIVSLKNNINRITLENMKYCVSFASCVYFLIVIPRYHYNYFIYFLQVYQYTD